MPEPVERGQRYMPGLDGLRAIAVLGVVLYHLGFGWAEGGLLGVGVFFTLSGYLITDILLNQVNRGGIRLKSFWLARARRLLPALFLMLIVVMAWVTVIGPAPAERLPHGAALSAVGYFNNWWLIFHNVSYFARFAPPSPLNHLWSLSVEEQFYIVWPFLLMVGVRFVPEASARAGVRPRLAAVDPGAALGSGILMAILYHPSLDPSRVYYGTDTRALELLVGAALAMVWPSRRLHRRITPQARRRSTAAGVARAGRDRADVLAGRRVLALPLPRRLRRCCRWRRCWRCRRAGPSRLRLGPIVGCRPMRWIGERSYGIYLWHSADHRPHHARRARHGPTCCAAILQVAAIVGVAELSWRYVENPIRHGALGRLLRSCRRAGGWRRGVRAGGAGRDRRPPASSLIAPSPGWPGSASSNSRAPIGSTNSGEDDEVAAEERAAGRRSTNLLRSGRPHRRLDLGGPVSAEYLPTKAN